MSSVQFCSHCHIDVLYSTVSLVFESHEFKSLFVVCVFYTNSSSLILYCSLLQSTLLYSLLQSSLYSSLQSTLLFLLAVALALHQQSKHYSSCSEYSKLVNFKFERQNQHKLPVRAADGRTLSIVISYGRTYGTDDCPNGNASTTSPLIFINYFSILSTSFTHACLLQVHHYEQVASARQVPHFHVPFVGSEGYIY